MDICGLKKNIFECFNSILDIVGNEKATLMEKTKLLELDWEDSEVQKDMFLSRKEFFENIIDELGSKYDVLNNLEVKIQEEFVNIFYSFIGKMINEMMEYFPLNDDLVAILDFVELKDDYTILKKKIKDFNKKFNIIKEENKVKLKEELVKLRNIKIEFYRSNSLNLLHMWNRIEKEEKLEFLPQIFKVAQTLPTSSASLEQSFSIIKLSKTHLRNKLSQPSLEGIVYIGQEFRDKIDIEISQKMVDAFLEVRKVFNKQKSGITSLKSKNEEDIKEWQNHNNFMNFTKIFMSIKFISSFSF